MVIPVSILITVRDRESTIDRCIESALNQTFKDFELIILDDGSTDGTPDRIRKWMRKDKRIEFVQYPKLGRYRAITVAQEMANGDYCLWLDSDDYLHPECISKMYYYLQDHEEVASVYANHVSIDIGDNKKRTKKKGKKYLEVANKDLLSYFICLHPFMYSRSIARFCWMNKDLTAALDYDLVLRFNDEFPIGYVDEELYYYSEAPTGRMSNDKRHQQMCAQIAQLSALSRRGIKGYTINMTNQLIQLNGKKVQ